MKYTYEPGMTQDEKARYRRQQRRLANGGAKNATGSTPKGSTKKKGRWFPGMDEDKYICPQCGSSHSDAAAYTGIDQRLGRVPCVEIEKRIGIR